ncbi:hypothetical protein BP6252_07517 [Coleophoma cylindrospora]|uniref:Uncharacterized protein n=1 Tax=Coleophoma cylindrospora TaxID=1849047 RepID=A0A3D8RAR6_9HELO|nr:hypothetical protein BP6252_07517 [Coleophoma cylindrospora]
MDIAASNALFWTSRGWDGSEAMVVRSRPYARRLPKKANVEIFSLEMLKTIIVVLQGIQALAGILGNFTSTGNYTTMDTVSGLFIPIAMCGLLRLCAALWLTDDFTFMAENSTFLKSSPSDLDKFDIQWSVDSLVDEHGGYLCRRSPTPLRAWGSRIFRAFYISIFLGLWVLTFLFITPWVGTFGWVGIWTTTSWMLGLFYITILTPLIAVFVFYFVQGPITSTIIPCISTGWYKAYSIYVTAFLILLVTVASIETRKTVCGKYTSLAAQYGDPCATGNVQLLSITTPTMKFGLTQDLGEGGGFVKVNFTGVCLGILGSSNK